MPFDLGDTVPLAATCATASGIPTNATTAVLTLTLPDGTTATPAVPAPGQTGQYRVDYPTTQAGRHAVRWLFTGPGSAYTDMFDVREAVPPLIVSLADMKSHLNITTTLHDADLRSWLETTTLLVESLAGACVRRTVTETHDIPEGGTLAVALRHTPVLTVTSASAVLTGGTSYQLSELDVDTVSGVVRRLDGGRLHGPLRFVYMPGRTVIPSNLTDAARIICQHLWRTRTPAGRAAPGGDDYAVTEPVPGFGYAIPNRAMQLLDPDRLPPGLA